MLRLCSGNEPRKSSWGRILPVLLLGLVLANCSKAPPSEQAAAPAAAPAAPAPAAPAPPMAASPDWQAEYEALERRDAENIKERERKVSAARTLRKEREAVMKERMERELAYRESRKAVESTGKEKFDDELEELLKVVKMANGGEKAPSRGTEPAWNAWFERGGQPVDVLHAKKSYELAL